MLSYRHVFHAGNHADVLKHVIYLFSLNYLTQKEKSLFVLDTHAGAGLYALKQNEEWKMGAGKLVNLDLHSPLILKDYIFILKKSLPQYYLGSPLLALKKLRKQDQLYLFERHPKDYIFLKKNIEKNKPEFPVFIHSDDGYQALKKLLPPPSRRGLILMDPPYETAADYEKLILALKEGLQRFSTGVYLIWYPILARRESVQLPKRLTQLGNRFLHVSLRSAKPPQNGFGLLGSGMLIINPPFQLLENLNAALPILAKNLGLNFNIDKHTA